MPGDSSIRRGFDSFSARCGKGWDMLRHRGPGQIQFWFIALAIGIASGFAALVFRLAIEWLQTTLYGTEDPNTLASFAETLPWYWILTIPMLGGAAVGLIVHFFTPDGRVRSVADVIEGAALNDGRLEKKAGIASALSSWITLSTGGSSGREGPVARASLEPPELRLPNGWARAFWTSERAFPCLSTASATCSASPPGVKAMALPWARPWMAAPRAWGRGCR